MGANLLALLKSHMPAIDKMKGSLLKEEAPKALALKNPTMREVDEHMVGPFRSSPAVRKRYSFFNVR